MNTQAIADRVTGRKAAFTIYELAGQEQRSLSDEGKTAMWEALRDLCLMNAPLPESPRPKHAEPMTDVQASHFEKTKMPWGKYANTTVGEVYDQDPDYLDYILEPDEFKTNLARYLLAMNRVPDLDDETIPY